MSREEKGKESEEGERKESERREKGGEKEGVTEETQQDKGRGMLFIETRGKLVLVDSRSYVFYVEVLSLVLGHRKMAQDVVRSNIWKRWVLFQDLCRVRLQGVQWTNWLKQKTHDNNWLKQKNMRSSCSLQERRRGIGASD